MGAYIIRKLIIVREFYFNLKNSMLRSFLYFMKESVQNVFPRGKSCNSLNLWSEM